MSDVACIVPAYNAAGSISSVIGELRATLPSARIIVVDDGSTDGTATAAAMADGVVHHDVNRGKGAALRSGFDAALQGDSQAIVTIDADGQHAPAVLPLLLEQLASSDIVVGARQRDEGGMPLHRRFTNRASAAAVKRITGIDIPDVQSGYRAMRRVVAETIRPSGNRYEFETEFLILSARAGYRISSVKVPTIYGQAGVASHFRLLRDGARVVSTIWLHR